jgi:hypothetical protein
MAQKPIAAAEIDTKKYDTGPVQQATGRMKVTADFGRGASAVTRHHAGRSEQCTGGLQCLGIRGAAVRAIVAALPPAS